MAEQKKQDPDDKAAPEAPKPAHYRVLSGGLTGAMGASYTQGDILTPDAIGDEGRVQKLLERGSIEEVK